MANNVYSKQLWSWSNPPTFQLGPVVPAGFIWDVREILAYNVQSDRAAVGHFRVGSNALGEIFGRFRGMNRGWAPYRWSGRCVLNPGDQLWFASQQVFWLGWITGYELALP